ncbi:TfoX/Sxy family protein [Burkholderia latens]|uniref:Competence protein TfoX n=1 Tax=Burkholderia latens TaxID=488446 RepID=A0A6H9TA50_9BURK|nr:TfoX/Sxy family protein [Burkholderia latens]KAB0638213.1 competence protein TfoX [Burkholderia latens]VWB08973.1 TfoX domain-containing protein [Burkholderia latens]
MGWQADKAHGEEIAYQIAGLGRVDVTRFFSGAAMRLDGVMFGFLARGSLFLRVDDVNRPAFVAAGMGPFSYAGRTRTVALEGYYETPADVLEDAGALFDWCRGAYRAALLAGAPKRNAKAVRARDPGAASRTARKRAPKPAPTPLHVPESEVAATSAPKRVKKNGASKPVKAPESEPASKAALKRRTTAKPAPTSRSELRTAAASKPAAKRSAKPPAKPPAKAVAKPASKPAVQSVPKRKRP